MDNGKIVTNEKDIAERFISKFANVIGELDLDSGWETNVDTGDLTNPIDIAIAKFDNHPSIIRIRENHQGSSPISFNPVDQNLI